MAWTDAERSRIEAIEKTLNNVQIAIKNLASQQQLRTLTQLRQKDINDLAERVTELESQITLLQNE